MIGDTSMNITDGQAQVIFDDNTEIIIPADTKAEIKGTFMDSGNGNDAYRLPKNDKLIVAGTLTVPADRKMEIAGTTKVTGEVVVSGANTAVEIVKLQSGEKHGTLNTTAGGAVTVENDATLNVGEYYVTGTVNVAAGAELVVVDDGVECQMIGDSSMDITTGKAQVKFDTNTEIIIPAGTEAEIEGTFMDGGNGNDAYRLPKNDKLTVAGMLTVPTDRKMEIAEDDAYRLPKNDKLIVAGLSLIHI